MSILDRRRFLCSAAAIATVGSVSGAVRYRQDGQVATGTRWEWVDSGRAFSTVNDVRCLDDGFLLVGTVQDDTDPSEGWATKLTANGDVSWSHRYASPDQRQALEDQAEVRTGPIPQDGFSFALPAVDGDGALLVGWTYYDNTAVYVGRLVRVDSAGEVLWERSISELTDDSAYSYLADGVLASDGDGYVLCGMESPGITLGGAGWVCSIAADGSLEWQRRYPATDRDLEQSGLRDVFTSIESTADGDGYVLSGHYEPDQNRDSRAWLVGLEESGDVRFDDRFDADGEGPTRAFDLAISDADGYDYLLVGSTGADVDPGDRQFFQPHEPGVEGDGFIAAYAADGERAWLERRAETPMFCTGRGPRGVVAGGVHRGRGWVGTVDRTDFEADRESAIASLCAGSDGELVGAGRLIYGDRTEGWARAIDVGADGDGDGDSESDNSDGDSDDESQERSDDESDSSGEDDSSDADENGDGDDSDASEDDENADDTDDPNEQDGEDGASIEFLDCETVRITGNVESVMLDVVWWSEDGLIGTITEPVGGVDGERTINASAEFGPFAYGPVLESVELFSETPATPGLGDRSSRNPNSDACREAIFDELEADGIDPDGNGSGGGGEGGDEDGDGDGDGDGGESGDSGGSTESTSETDSDGESESTTDETTDGTNDSSSDDGTGDGETADDSSSSDETDDESADDNETGSMFG